MKNSVIPLLMLFALQGLYGQSWQERRDSINRISYQEHQLMLNMLGIDELRPGPSGNPDAPNAANSDESKATTYSTLLDPLIFDDGTRVRNMADWKRRKVEITEHFDREVYGRVPSDVPSVTWRVLEEKDTVIGEYPAIWKDLVGIVDNSAYPQITVEIKMTLTTPAGKPDAVPVMVEFGWEFPGSGRRNADSPTWQELLLEKGWGYAILIPTSYQADHGAGLRSGIIGLTNQGRPRKADDWGTLRAWAWGTERTMDYFETDPRVDAKRVGIEGLSRYGKAAIVAMVYEPRIAIGFIGSSGAGGTKILRRNFGEQVENLASSGEFHWFAPNFVKYAGPLTPNDLPVDAHHLVALCAPRPVFISTGAPAVEGNWVDARGMFLAAVYAGPVYRLHGKRDLGVTSFPPPGTSLIGGDIAFRQHEGGHTVIPNWPFFIRFAERYFTFEHNKKY
ncbi:MAG: acetylxylan esterase [Bacteroidales bacterium]